jgi:hypothetical protein
MRSILSRRAVNSAVEELLWAALGGGLDGLFGEAVDGRFDGEFGAGALIDAAAVGAASRDGITPANHSAAATTAVTSAPKSAVAIYAMKGRGGPEAGRSELEACWSDWPPLSSAAPAAACSAVLLTSVAANSMVGGRRLALSSESLVMRSLLKQIRLNVCLEHRPESVSETIVLKTRR